MYGTILWEGWVCMCMGLSYRKAGSACVWDYLIGGLSLACVWDYLIGGLGLACVWDYLMGRLSLACVWDYLIGGLGLHVYGTILWEGECSIVVASNCEGYISCACM